MPMDVAALIERIKIKGRTGAYGWCRGYGEPRPLEPAVLATLAAPGGMALPPSLAAWLAYDASWLELFVDGQPPRWNLTSVRAFVETEVAEIAAELGDYEGWNEADTIADILAKMKNPALADAPAIQLPDSASQAHLLVFHAPRADGEVPVLGYEKEEFWPKYPSFGAFLAHYFGGEEP
jgi:hypothetical protein